MRIYVYANGNLERDTQQNVRTRRGDEREEKEREREIETESRKRGRGRLGRFLSFLMG
jgi:hypothetical protein